MHKFGVWAPRAKTVAVKLGTDLYPLESDERGWWSAKVANAGPGSTYRFVLDEGDPLPDPRSQFQPEGVNGPSQLVDHSSFAWSDAHWQSRPLSSALIYEVHIGTFTPAGTYLSTIERLDYLAELGITHVEIMPVAEFPGDAGWGYDGVDLYAPHHIYGSPDELKTLVNACHQKGLAVILDVVYNHLGPAGNYLPRFGPYFTDVYHTPWGSAVNLDHEGSVETRQFFVDNARMWLGDYHFDGLRLDAVHAYFDHSAIHFLEQLTRAVSTLSAHLGRYLFLIAESDLNDPRIVTCLDAGGFGIDAQWSDDFHHALHTTLTGETSGYYQDFGSLSQLAKALGRPFVYDGVPSPHRGRIHGKSVCKLSGHRFLAYAQNHDQVGNRAAGERLSHLTSLGRSKIAAALVLTSPYIPMLFQGEEFGASSPFQYFTHHEDHELAANVSAGRKNEFKAFGWAPEDVPDPQDRETMDRSKLLWDELSTPPHSDLLAWYKKLIALRRQYSCLTDGRLDKVDVSFDADASWLAMKRGPIQVVYNLAQSRQRISIESVAQVLLCSESDYELAGDAITLPPDSVAILV
ncbi:MAG TPA: malto-oligosyltrehalose trehalohydrolase [Bryobacteraceae bacterium]|jgi:maltooligosyltrehalose trehalohydrolase|nr:malto-oligosyltrehalose trehalohydrolase [Bryobacteraceae bacterium]